MHEDSILQAQFADLPLHLQAPGAFSHEMADEVHVALSKPTTCFHEVAMTFHFLVGGHTQDPHRSLVTFPLARHKDLRIHAAVHDVDLLLHLRPALLDDNVPVVIRDRDDERRRLDLTIEHRAVDVQIGAVGGEAEWNSGQAMDDESGESRMRGEVSVNVLDSRRFHLVCKAYGLWKDPDRTQQEVPAPGGSPQNVAEEPKVFPRATGEVMEVRAHDGQGEKRVKPHTGHHPLDFGVSDECLGQLRETRHDIGHTRRCPFPPGPSGKVSVCCRHFRSRPFLGLAQCVCPFLR
jgi:hypothetical protein